MAISPKPQGAPVPPTTDREAVEPLPRQTLKELLLAPEPRWDMPLPRRRKLRWREPPDFTDETDADPSKR
jgi:hypothetical protein